MTDNLNFAEAENIRVAADLLRRMFLELQNLAWSRSRLHFAMLDASHATQQRLDMLVGIAESLKAASVPSEDADRSKRAKALIHQLAKQLEEWSLTVDGDLDWIEVV